MLPPNIGFMFRKIFIIKAEALFVFPILLMKVKIELHCAISPLWLDTHVKCFLPIDVVFREVFLVEMNHLSERLYFSFVLVPHADHKHIKLGLNKTKTMVRRMLDKFHIIVNQCLPIKAVYKSGYTAIWFCLE